MTEASPPPADSDPLIGQLFAGRYLVRRAIARGAMGRVYEAEQQPLGRAVAVKVLDVSPLRDSTGGGNRYQERFLREASLLSRLTHPNTVRIYDFGFAGSDSFLVMEYVRGVTLRALLAGTPLDPLRAVRIARQICGSLTEAHGLGLVHRDLKPGNVLVAPGPDGDAVKVVDFGLVKEIEDAANMTGDGTMVGTPMYMAPEQIRGRKLDQRCDIYALGVMLYYTVTARFPFDDGQPAAVMMAHLTAPPLPLSRSGRHVPESLEWTILRCLEKEREDRFLDARELGRALELCEAVLLEGSSVGTAHLSLAGGRLILADPAPPRRRLGAAVVVGFLLTSFLLACLTVATIGGFGLVRGLSSLAADPRPAAQEVAPAVAPAPEPEPEPAAEPAPEPEPAPDPAPEPAPVARSPRPAPVARPPVAPTPSPPAAPLEVRSSDLKDPW